MQLARNGFWALINAANPADLPIELTAIPSEPSRRMTTNDPMNLDPMTPDADLPIGVLLRLAADDELTPEQRARLDAHLASNPRDADCIAFESGLRGACGRVLADCRCPGSLREKVMAIAASSRGEVAAGVGAEIGHSGTGVSGIDHEDAYADAIATRSAQLRGAGVFSGVKGRIAGALAAALLLIASAAFVIRVVGVNSAEQADGSGAHILLAGMVTAEHESCVEAKAAKFSVTTRDEAPAFLASILGSEPSIADFEALGLQFDRVGRCGVPGNGPSAHMIFKTKEIEGCQKNLRVSLFIQHGGHPEFAMQPDTTYTIGKCSSKTVYAWRSGEMTYYLVAPNASCKALARAMPTQVIALIQP